MKDKDNHKSVFKHHEYIVNKIKLNEISDNLKAKNSNHYLDTSILNQLNNLDSKLLFFLLFNFERFIDYNSLPTVKSNICLLIVKLIKYLFNQFYTEKTNYQLNKSEILINFDKPIVDEQLTGVGIYQEVPNQEELDDPEKKKKTILWKKRLIL